jgi:hypothetical protein
MRRNTAFAPGNRGSQALSVRICRSPPPPGTASRVRLSPASCLSRMGSPLKHSSCHCSDANVARALLLGRMMLTELMSAATTTATGHCVKCTVQREIKDIKRITLKNGRPATEGICSVCGNKMFTIGAEGRARNAVP